MAYGKIKADAIIYDDSGSDVEKTIAVLASAASTASPTFTGDVTLTGASYNVVLMPRITLLNLLILLKLPLVMVEILKSFIMEAIIILTVAMVTYI